ncbi:MAG TPA: helicase-related protein, partial [Ilumatobacteraceae bacterium]|nr:helicase-related protein [Ilumatobacteraceae bacterium]
SGSISHTAYIVARQHKAAALGRILDVEEPTAAIVFCRTRGEVDTLTETLNGRGYRAEALHGGMDQEQRDRVMGRMRSATAELLIATDVAARGLDLDHLTHVVNYDVPSSTEAYTHRVGRVGRAGRSGVAITLTEPREQRLLGNIERVMGTKVKIAQIPNVAELRAHQEESTRNDLREAVLAGDDGRFQRVVDSLAEEFDLREIAAAAARLYHQAAGNVEDAEEIPEARPPKPDRGDRFDKGAGRKGAYGKGSGKGGGDDRVQIFIWLGRAARLSPGDLVGAIANETSLSGKQIGPIKIGEKFSIVGVPPESVDEVIDALRQTQIRGRSAQVRRYVENRQPPRDRKHNRK